jgi:hypothetical protein
MGRFRILLAVLAGSAAVSTVASADEGGISYWLPGLYGSFAATPTEPGWSWAMVYIHLSADASADEAFPRGGRGRVSLGVSGRGTSSRSDRPIRSRRLF